MSSRRSFARRQLRRSLRTFLAANPWPLGALAGLYAGMVAFSQLAGADGYWFGFANGAVLVSIVSAVGVLFLLHTGAIRQLAGVYGEDRTAEELAKAVKKGWAWGAVHNVELADGDIDTIVVAPAGILAVETKWTMHDLERRWLDRDVAQAARGARKARAVLRSRDIGEVHVVAPVLVIWGRGARDVAAGGELIDGVHVVAGDEFRNWMRRCADGPFPRDEAQQLVKALSRFAERHAVA